MKSVVDVNLGNWETEVLQSNILTVVDFWHRNCPWCIRLDPIFKEVEAEYRGKIKFAKLNVLEPSENREIAIKYGVMGTPTLVFFCFGRPLGALTGFVPKEHLKHILDDMLEKYGECVKHSTELEK